MSKTSSTNDTMKQYKYTINGAQFDVTIDSIVGSKAKVEVNGIPFEVEMQGSSLVEEALPTVSADAEAPAPAAAPAAAEAPAAAPAATSGPGAGSPVKAPLPGVVTKILVSAGQAVKKGDTVLVLEAMKMENNITAEADGKVTGICVNAGDSVMEGTTLLTIG